MNLIDTNIFISAFAEEDQRHKEALKILKGAGKIVLLDYVLNEIATVLLFKYGRDHMRRIIEYIINSDNIELVQLNLDELVESMGNFMNQEKGLSFIDMALLTLSRTRKLKLITFDKELAQFAKE